MSLIITIVVIVLLVGVVLWVIGVFNSLQRKRVQYQGAWSDIDTQLKRRYDLIPNLVNTVKGYAAHEKETLEAVIAARQRAIDAKSVKEQAGAENMLTQAIGRLFALAEAYPELKANQNFMHLQEELVGTENKIQFSRQHYNRTASQFNESIVVFPNNIVATIFNMSRAEFFEIEDRAQREAPKVEF